MAVAASTSMPTIAVPVLLHRFPATRPAAISCTLHQRPSLSSSSPSQFKLLTDSGSSPRLLVKASSSEESTLDTNELLLDLKEKWDAVENKTTVILYGGGAIVAVWLASIIVGAINSIPLLPKVMELVGLGYTGWFVYRYLLFKSSRKELATDIEELKRKVAGTE